MLKLKLTPRTTAAIMTAAIATGISLYATRSEAVLQDSPKQLVDEAWQIVYREYVDRTFNHNDWLVVRQKYLRGSYGSQQQAYQAIREMLDKLQDPYTSFLDPQQIKNLMNDVSGDFIGIGLTVAVDQSTKEWIVVTPFKGAPAASAGILPEDVIVKINGQSTPEIDTRQASKYLLGPVGSQVFLTIRRGNQELNFKLTREHIDLHPLTYRLQDTAVGKIGYIYLPVFTSKSAEAMRNAIQALEKQNVKGYILDLRTNPGGILDTSLEIARMWLSKGTVVSIIDYQGKKDRFAARHQALTDKPLQVLVDHDSASASEILAGALQDNHRATLVGTRTFGKGLVQSLEALEDGSGVKITIARYYTPKGRDINKVGIAPDVVVPLTDEQRAALIQDRAIATPADPQYVRALANLTQAIQARLIKAKS
jgi:carboxyl-terminal processing protease